MSLYGSLFSGVSGLSAQGTAIGIISDNIANINTVGYKGGSQIFDTMVTNSGSNVSYSSGGVNAGNRQLVDQQGLLQATSSATDLAITGNGFFVVSDKVDGTGGIAYSRAGSFRKDSLGNFVNAAGYYLQAWPLDAEGRLPGQPGNLNTTSTALVDSLVPVNIGSASGSASATSKVSLGVNLNASESVFKGAGDNVIAPISTSVQNFGIAADDILVPNASIAAGNGITIASPSSGLTQTYTYGGFSQSNLITGGILGATSPSMAFAAAVVNDGLTITVPSIGTKTFVFKNSSPNTANLEFKDLNTLAQAIDGVVGLSARVQGGRLYVAPEDANEAMTFGNYGGGGSNFGTALGFANTTASTNRFASLGGLADLVNATQGVSAVTENATSNTNLDIYIDDPLATITYANAGGGAFLTELGIGAGPFGPSYDPNAAANNMASGALTPHFTRNVRVYDSLGSGHDFSVSFMKLANNTWGVEIYAANPDEISSSLNSGQIATGQVVFNGDGTLRSISPSLSNQFVVSWTNGAAASNVEFGLGTAGQPLGTAGATVFGKADGLRQFSSNYSVDFVNQNGAASGLLDSVSVDSDGYVIANYNNGETKRIYKIPLADFSNPNGLTTKNGNVFTQSYLSGEYNLREAGSGGVGTISPSSLESANVELSEELTDMIVAQRAYQASSKVISTVDELLDELNRI